MLNGVRNLLSFLTTPYLCSSDISFQCVKKNWFAWSIRIIFACSGINRPIPCKCLKVIWNRSSGFVIRNICHLKIIIIKSNSLSRDWWSSLISEQQAMSDRRIRTCATEIKSSVKVVLMYWKNCGDNNADVTSRSTKNCQNKIMVVVKNNLNLPCADLSFAISCAINLWSMMYSISHPRLISMKRFGNAIAKALKRLHYYKYFYSPPTSLATWQTLQNGA